MLCKVSQKRKVSIGTLYACTACGAPYPFCHRCLRANWRICPLLTKKEEKNNVLSSSCDGNLNECMSAISTLHYARYEQIVKLQSMISMHVLRQFQKDFNYIACNLYINTTST